MVYLLSGLSLVVFVALLLAVRRLRRDDEKDSVLYGIATSLAVIAGATAASGILFSIVASSLPSASGDEWVTAAFRAEQRLNAFQQFVDRLTPPWPLMAGLLFIVFIASARRTAAGQPTTAARAAMVMHRGSRPLLKFLGALNVVLAIACSFTLFGRALDTDSGEFRARLRAAGEQIEQVGHNAAAIARVETQLAAVRAVVAAAPPAVKQTTDLIDEVAREQNDLQQERDSAERNLHVYFRPASAPIRPPGGAGAAATAAQSPGAPARPSARPASTWNESDRSTLNFDQLDRAVRVTNDRVNSPEFARQASFIANLETRKEFTGFGVEATIRAPWLSVIESANLSPLADAVARAAVDIVAEALNQHLDEKVSKWLLAQFTTTAPTADDLSSRVEFEARKMLDASLRDQVNEAARGAVMAHADALSRAAQRARDQLAAIDADRSALRREVAAAEARLQQRRTEAIARLNASLTPRTNANAGALFGEAAPSNDLLPTRLRDLLGRRRRVTEGQLALYLTTLEHTPLTIDAIETLERQATAAERGEIPSELQPKVAELRPLTLPEPRLGAGQLTRPSESRPFEGGRFEPRPYERPVYRPRPRPRIIPRR